jgi:hypothetical protein
MFVGADGGNAGAPASAPNSRSNDIQPNSPVQPNYAPTGRKDPGPANTPEAPIAVMLPLLGAIAAAGTLYIVTIRNRSLPVVE